VTHDIRFVEDLPYPIGQVWESLVDSATLGEWLMPNDFEPRIGKRFVMRCPPGPGIRGWVECVVLELEAPHRMVWSWSATDDGEPSQVEFQLEPISGGTRLTLIHSREPRPDQRKRFTAGWAERLAELRSVLAS
jgi:uncharacterized protein YndB with AHSA1/START domain